MAIRSLESERYKAKVEKKKKKRKDTKPPVGQWNSLLTFHMLRHGVCVQEMKTVLRLESMMDHYQDQRNFRPDFPRAVGTLAANQTSRRKDEPVHSQTPSRKTTSYRRQSAIGP